MAFLGIGLALWLATHLAPLFAPSIRSGLVSSMGEGPYKGVYALISLAAIVLMVLGYQGADFTYVFDPPAWGWHLNNLLMIVAIALFGGAHSKGNLKRHVRHPQLLSVAVWAVAHLLVNGDLASLVLFGGLGLWSILAIFACNARDGAWVRPDPAPVRKDILLAVITVVTFVLVVVIHWQVLGVRPFPG